MPYLNELIFKENLRMEENLYCLGRLSKTLPSFLPNLKGQFPNPMYIPSKTIWPVDNNYKYILLCLSTFTWHSTKHGLCFLCTDKCYEFESKVKIPVDVCELYNRGKNCTSYRHIFRLKFAIIFTACNSLFKILPNYRFDDDIYRQFKRYFKMLKVSVKVMLITT